MTWALGVGVGGTTVGAELVGAAVGTSKVGNTDGVGAGANNSTVPSTILRATAAFRANEA